jgi:hypothetical protein
MRRAVVALALSAACAAGLLGAASALGCSCVAIAPETRFDESDAAVIVRLVEVVPRGQYDRVLRYRVRQVLKGERRIDVGQVLTLPTQTNSSCALPHREGRRYGLFLRRVGRRWTATLCDVTTPEGMRDAAAAAGQAGRAGPSCPG